MFKFQHSQIKQQEFEQLADLILKYPNISESSKFDVGKVNSPLDLPSNLIQFSTNNEQLKSQFFYKTKLTNFLKY